HTLTITGHNDGFVGTSRIYTVYASISSSDATYQALSLNNLRVTNTDAVPNVTLNPTSQTVNAGMTATFTAAATGGPTPSVQWFVSSDGGASFNAIPGATSTTLSFVASASDNGKLYAALFANSAGSAFSGAAHLTVIVPPAPPSITLQPAPTTTVLTG